MKNCIVCNKEFVAYRSNCKQKCCSRDCFKKYFEYKYNQLYPKIKRNCIICNKQILADRKNQKTCRSIECIKQVRLQRDRDKYNMHQKKIYIKICIWCKREFITSKNYQNKCNNECTTQFWRDKEKHKYKKKSLKEQNCSICNKIFITNNSKIKCCNISCQKIRNKRFSKKIDIKKICLFCGKEFITTHKQKICCCKTHQIQYSIIRIKQRNTHRYYNDYNYKFKIGITNNIRFRISKRDNIKLDNTEELLGCTINELKAYLEKKFQFGMTWENHGLYGWHIDHIIPISTFDLTNIKEQKKCFHYTNLQPLWCKENLRKSDKIIKSQTI